MSSSSPTGSPLRSPSPGASKPWSPDAVPTVTLDAQLLSWTSASHSPNGASSSPLPSASSAPSETYVHCGAMHLRLAEGEHSIRLAVNEHVQNAVQTMHFMKHTGRYLEKEDLALLTTKFWDVDGATDLTVAFIDKPAPPNALQIKILKYMNRWSKYANVGFRLLDRSSREVAKVRISVKGIGHWSYIGTDILAVPHHEPTMNLQDFSLDTPESEFLRVVQHETGHTLGFVHEHLREELVKCIDPEKAYTFYEATQGWTREQTYANILTPVRKEELRGSLKTDTNSIMCYAIPSSILKKPGAKIMGGTDLDDIDKKTVALLYPKSAAGKQATKQGAGKTTSTKAKTTTGTKAKPASAPTAAADSGDSDSEADADDAATAKAEDEDSSVGSGDDAASPPISDDESGGGDDAAGSDSGDSGKTDEEVDALQLMKRCKAAATATLAWIKAAEAVMASKQNDK